MPHSVEYGPLPTDLSPQRPPKNCCCCMGQKSYLLTAFILTVIEAVFGAGGVGYLWWYRTIVDDIEDAVVTDQLNEDNPAIRKGFDMAQDWITALAVVYTIFLVFYVIMAILIYKYYDSVPEDPPQQPLRVIQPVTRVDAYPQPGTRF